jgi:FtsX-like permease family protein
MRGLAASFLARRMLASRLLLGSVLLTVLITSTLTAALVTFGTEGLPQAVHHQLQRSASVSVTISGSVNAPTAVADTKAVSHAMRTAFGQVPYRFDQARWSNPLGLPAASGGKTVPLTQAATLSQIEANAALVRGRWPGLPPPGHPIEAALPDTAAQRLGLAPGAVLTLRDRVTGHRIRVRLTGLFGLRDPASPYWGIDPVGTSGVSVQAQFVTYGPLVVNPAAFSGHGLTVGGAAWLVRPDGGRISTTGISMLGDKVASAQSYLENADRLGGLQVRTGLPQLLAGLGHNLVVARSLLTMGLLQLLLLAAVALSLAARLLASHREEESALLSSRGAARWQMVRPAIAEAVVLGVVAAGAGAVLGSRVAGPLMNTGALRGTGLHTSGIPAGAWLAALAVLVLSTLILLWPAMRPASAGEVRTRRGRQAALAGIARAGGDVALVALAVLAVVELRSYSAVAHSPAGGLGLDPVPVLAPTLALAGVTLVPLRLLPALAKAIDGLIAKTKRLGAALASWEISRRPIRQSGPVLLVILAVGTGTLALSQYQSWRQSAQDQAAFAVGSDFRVDTLAPLPLATSGRIAHTPGVTEAMPVTSTITGSGDVLGLDAQQAPSAVLLRQDLAPVPVSELWRDITPRSPVGVPLAGHPARLRLAASLAGGGAPPLGSASATVTVQDAGGVVYSVPAGELPADGRSHALTATLSPARRASYPLRLLGVSLAYTLPPFGGPKLAALEGHHPATLTITSLATSTSAAGGFGPPTGADHAFSSWQPSVFSPALGSLASTVSVPALAGVQPAVRSWRPVPGHAQTLTFRPGQAPTASVMSRAQLAQTDITGNLTIGIPSPAKILPAIATQSYLHANHVGTGTIVPMTVDGANIPMKLVAAVSKFPTAAPGGALIVDQGELQAVLASRGDPPLPVTEWWLRAATGVVPRGLPKDATVADRAAQASSTLQDPISAVPQQAALAIAAAATLLAALGFSVSVAASLRARQTQSAVLAALGVARTGQAGQLCLEQLMLSLPAAAAGLLAGAGLAHALVPAVTLTTDAATPVPPVLVELPLAWSLLLALAVAAIPVAVAAFSVARRPDPAAQLRAAQAS